MCTNKNSIHVNVSYFLHGMGVTLILYLQYVCKSPKHDQMCRCIHTQTLWCCVPTLPTCPGCSHGVWYSARWHKSLTRWYLGRKFSSWATSFPSPSLCSGFLSAVRGKPVISMTLIIRGKENPCCLNRCESCETLLPYSKMLRWPN